MPILKNFRLRSPSIPLKNDEPVNVTGTTFYDLTVIHPKTTYYYSRPTWLALSNRRQPVSIKTTNKNIFLVQAYYQFESFGTKPGQVVPADQTYFSYGNGVLHFISATGFIYPDIPGYAIQNLVYPAPGS